MPVLARAKALPPIPVDNTRPAFSWTDPDGNFWNLSDLGMKGGLLATTIGGIGAPPVALTTVPLPSGDVQVQSLLPQPHQIVMGLYAEGFDPSAFHTLVNSITKAFYTVRRNKPAPGVLTIRQQDGTARQINCYVTSGLDQPTDPYPLLQATWSLTMQGDPYWTDQYPQPVLTLAPSSLTSVTNDGDGDAFPTWKIYGPGQPLIKNSGTGDAFTFNQPVADGDVWTVTIGPDGTSTVLDQNGNSQWATLAPDQGQTIPTLWSLPTGTTEIEIVMQGAGKASKVTMQYTRRWLRA